jgi:histidinol-phosphate aminotransferase
MEIIRLIALSYFGRGDLVLILKPTFGEYEISCQLVGSRIIEQWAREEAYFAFDADRIVSMIKEHSLKGVFICNPSNPTGQYLTRRETEKVLAACQESLVVLDEAYGAFTEGKWSSVPLISRGNTIIIHSMTKDYALAGLRLGYALASEGVIRNLIKARPPWNVNIVAQKAGILALKESYYVEECALKIDQAKKFLMAELGKIGLMVLPSKTNFFLVRVGDAGRFRRSLLSRGIIVRDCTSFGLPEYVRVGVLKMSECRKLVGIIKELKNNSELGI